jgi:hypothetical protein
LIRTRRTRFGRACVLQWQGGRPQSHQAGFNRGNVLDALAWQIPEEGIVLVNRGKQLEPMRPERNQGLLICKSYVGFYDRMNG